MSASEHLDDEMSREFLDEHVEHADERWLMSYADMMTLLFGLFVMLYAMVDNFSVIQESAGLKFSSSTQVGGTQEDPAVALQLADNALEKVKIENETLRVKVEALETSISAEKAKVAEANAMMEIIKAKPDVVQVDQSALIRSLEEERNELRSKLAMAHTENAKVRANNRNADNFARPGERRVDMRSDGLGGHAEKASDRPARPQARPNYEVKFTLQNGRTVERTLHGGFSLNGMSLDEPLPTEPNQNIDVTITRDGESAQGVLRTMVDDQGQLSRRLRFMNFKDNSRETIIKWTNGN